MDENARIRRLDDEAADNGGLIARASLPAAPHPAPWGWHPAPLYSWPTGRRPWRDNLQRCRGLSSPSQIGAMLPLVPSDIFYPAQSGSPLLPVTRPRSRCNYAPQRIPFRGNRTKVNLRRALKLGFRHVSRQALKVGYLADSAREFERGRQRRRGFWLIGSGELIEGNLQFCSSLLAILF